MSTVIRPVISSKNQYYISKHRYYELKHFCMQYGEWKDLYKKLNAEPRTGSLDGMPRKTDISNPTEKVAIAKAEYSRNMKMIEDVAQEADSELGSYIFMAVTRGISYTTLQTKYDIPCCKDTFYDRYRRFFWLLSSTRR